MIGIKNWILETAILIAEAITKIKIMGLLDVSFS